LYYTFDKALKIKGGKRNAFFKKVFLIGLIFLFALWLIFSLFKLLYNFLKPLRDLLFLVIGHRTPGLEFAAVIIITLILGLFVQLLSRLAPSKIPIINRIFKFTRFIHGIAYKLDTGEIKTAKVKIHENLSLLGFTTGETTKINDEEVITVLLPSTPNPTTGYAIIVPAKNVEYLPKHLNKFVLKTIITAGLLK